MVRLRRDGNPVSITGAELQTFTHQWRKYSDAILTTAKTINADNPQLNVRLNGETFCNPLYFGQSIIVISVAQILNCATYYHFS